MFVFDPFGGYFPGPIYDEALRPPERLLHFRLVNLRVDRDRHRLRGGSGCAGAGPGARWLLPGFVAAALVGGSVGALPAAG